MHTTKLTKAFTLIEILIVLAVIGVLAAIVIASTASARAGARDTRRVGDLKEIQLGLAVYYDVNRSYPAALSTLAATGQKYLPAIPTDPTGAAYEYVRLTTTTYCLGATLESLNHSPGDNSACSTGGSANYKVQQPN